LTEYFMMKPLLFIQTCRAGRHNHRFLVPAGAGVDDKSVSRFTEQAKAVPEGGNYLAEVRHNILQQGSARMGDDVIVLVGVNVSRLKCDGTLTQCVREGLRSLHDRLEDFLTRQMSSEWEKAGVPLVIERSELNEWLQELELQLPAKLPEHANRTEPLPATRGPNARWLLWGGGAVALLLTVAASVALLRPMDNPKQQEVPPKRTDSATSTDHTGTAPPKKDVPKLSPREVVQEERLDQLFKQWQATNPDEGRQALCAAMNAIVRERPSTLNSPDPTLFDPTPTDEAKRKEALRKSPTIEQFLRRSGSKQALYLIADEPRERFEAILPKRLELADIRAIRRKLIALRDALRPLNQDLPTSLSVNEGAKMASKNLLACLERCKRAKVPEILKESPLVNGEPAPFFEDVDASTITWLDDCLSPKLIDLLSPEDADRPKAGADLMSRLKYLRKLLVSDGETAISRPIERAREDLEKPDRVLAQNLKPACEKLKTVLTRVADLCESLQLDH
jgi:hypothetical protein